jgi:hypothetical protein
VWFVSCYESSRRIDGSAAVFGSTAKGFLVTGSFSWRREAGSVGIS